MDKHPNTKGRELALQYLYMHDFLKGKDVEPLLDFLGSCAPKPDYETAAFASNLVETVLKHRQELDAEIAAIATNWRLDRMAIVDRNILRMGLAELISFPDTPYKVCLNEAIELARLFSSEASCAFVNGLLDKLRAKHRPQDASMIEKDVAASSNPDPDVQPLYSPVR